MTDSFDEWKFPETFDEDSADSLIKFANTFEEDSGDYAIFPWQFPQTFETAVDSVSVTQPAATGTMNSASAEVTSEKLNASPIGATANTTSPSLTFTVPITASQTSGVGITQSPVTSISLSSKITSTIGTTANPSVEFTVPITASQTSGAGFTQDAVTSLSIAGTQSAATTSTTLPTDSLNLSVGQANSTGILSDAITSLSIDSAIPQVSSDVGQGKVSQASVRSLQNAVSSETLVGRVPTVLSSATQNVGVADSYNATNSKLTTTSSQATSSGQTLDVDTAYRILIDAIQESGQVSASNATLGAFTLSSEVEDVTSQILEGDVDLSLDSTQDVTQVDTLSAAASKFTLGSVQATPTSDTLRADPFFKFFGTAAQPLAQGSTLSGRSSLSLDSTQEATSGIPVTDVSQLESIEGTLQSSQATPAETTLRVYLLSEQTNVISTNFDGSLSKVETSVVQPTVETQTLIYILGTAEPELISVSTNDVSVNKLRFRLINEKNSSEIKNSKNKPKLYRG